MDTDRNRRLTSSLPACHSLLGCIFGYISHPQMVSRKVCGRRERNEGKPSSKSSRRQPKGT
ncbi:hypothetical protein E2320_012059 [Naja naja]|nr:hypothetical protein E2320_012059 [Naja naja]